MSAESLKDYPAVDDWIAFRGGRVTVHTGKVDIGQRVSTALALIAAEELDVPFSAVDVDTVDTAQSLDEEYTSASNSLERCGESVRLAAATARRHVLGIAAGTLGVAVEALDVREGRIGASGLSRSTSYWELVGEGPLGIPVDLAVRPKRPEEYRVIGTRVPALDLEQLVSGTAPFVHDIQLPGMLHARLVRPPHYHARVASIDPGLHAALGDATLVRDGSFLAVVAADEHRAIRGAARAASAVQWAIARTLDTTPIHELLTTAPRISLPVRNGAALEEPVPPLHEPPGNAAVTISRRIERPYLMHGSIGPSAAAAQLVDGTMTIWTHTQGVFPLRATIAESLRMPVENVRLIQRRGPGCYGHNGADDAALEAALIARQLPGRPVLLKWSREDEHAWEPYGPAMVVTVRASLDAAGNVVDWCHETFSDTHRTRPRPQADQAGPARMLSTHFIENPFPEWAPKPFLSASLAGIHRGADPYYTFANRRVIKHLVPGMPLRTSTLRSLGCYTNVLAIETVIDELARAAGRDPVEFRLANLDDPRARDVIEAVAKHAGWGQERAVEPGHGRGFAFARYNNLKAYAAVVVDLRVDDAAEAHVSRVTIAADAGQIVDHDGLRLQIEGGALQGLSWTLLEQVTYDSGGVTSRDWDTYPILRFDEVPEVDTVLIDRPGEPYLGPSECSLAPTAAAIANAIFHATGLRLRRLPFNADAIRAAALEE